MSKKNIKLVLNQYTQHLGNAGDIIYVSRGHARNYLIPQKLAEPLTKGRINYIEKIKTKELIAQEKRKRLNLDLQNQLQTINKFSLKRKISDNDNIFGSITEKDVIDIVKDTTGISLEKSQINLPLIRTIGIYDIPITLISNIDVNIKLQILPETT
uniref:Large ribosomal subunit protein bL9c n=1 Tax=Helminthocladia australis TaxID=260093 RepID=A0A1G4NTM4_9FLOR|nr:Ribosomal protein L9 [Helminthocladia australis]SCW22043.1 Ribosomal protein L9 [Helminthocladia australis]